MRRLKIVLAMIMLTLLTVTGAIQTNKANAAETYTVRKEQFGQLIDSLYVKDMTTGEDVVAYCYNAHKSWPGIRNQTVYKYGNASNDDFLKLTDNPRDPTNLKKHVMEVCYKGFPRNGIGLREKYGLDNDAFRMITQTAIWYYTDSLDLQKTRFWISYDWMWTDKAKQAYYELIQTPVTLPSNFTLDLYKNRSNSFQNILSTKLSKDYVPPKEYSIEFSKKDESLAGAELKGATLQVLKSDGTKIDEWTSNGSTHKIKLVAGDYIFRETNAPTGYTKVSDIKFKVGENGIISIISKTNPKDEAQVSGSKLTVVDKKIPVVYKSLSVTKKWELYGHAESEIPNSVQVQLYANNVAQGAPVTLDKSKNWSYTWDKLDSTKEYTVQEVNTPDNCVSRVEKVKDGEFVIYNAMKPELTVKKIVRDGEWADKTRQFDFNIELKDENNQPISGTFDYLIEKEDGTQVSTGKLVVNDGNAKFKLAHEQKIRIKGLPLKVIYRVQEVTGENAAFVASYATKNIREQKDVPFVQITNENPDNEVTVYNTFKYIVDTGVDLNNDYTMPGAFLLITGILLFSGISVLRFRKRVK